MRICITNDDGIHGEGLLVLANWAKKLGDVTIFAPKFQQSGKSHSIEIHQPFEVRQVEHPSGVRAFTVDSTPADCVRVALLAMKESFDLILSGVNCGYNLGREIIYSGTVGAALEASVHGVKAIALSTGFDTFEGAAAHLDTVWDYITRHQLLNKAQVLNVNRAVPSSPIPLSGRAICSVPAGTACGFPRRMKQWIPTRFCTLVIFPSPPCATTARTGLCLMPS